MEETSGRKEESGIARVAGEDQTGSTGQTADGSEVTEETVKTAPENQGTEADPADLQVLKEPRIYSYEDMMGDVQLLEMLYPEDFSTETLARTADGRQVQLLVVGDPQAGKKIFVNAGIHGREYITSQLVMKQTAVFLEHLRDGDSYKAQPYRSLMDDCAVYVVPMVNPDGISISQQGMEGILTETVRENVERIAALDGQTLEEDYLTKW